MKKAQTTVEYVMFIFIIVIFCAIIMLFWNRKAIIHNSTFGVEMEDSAIHVRPMAN